MNHTRHLLLLLFWGIDREIYIIYNFLLNFFSFFSVLIIHLFLSAQVLAVEGSRWLALPVFCLWLRWSLCPISAAAVVVVTVHKPRLLLHVPGGYRADADWPFRPSFWMLVSDWPVGTSGEDTGLSVVFFFYCNIRKHPERTRPLRYFSVFCL